MPLAGLENTTGTKVYVVAGEPAGNTVANWKALSWSEIIGIVSMGPFGDTAADVSEPVLGEDRVIHTNGMRDGGNVPLVVQHRTTDAGAALIKSTDGGNTLISIRKVYKSGDVEVATGILSPVRQRPVAGDAVRGFTCDFRANTAVTSFTAAEWATG